MRVTNSMLVSNFMNNLNINMNKMSGLQTQLQTGRKYASITDDPVSAIYSMQARFRLERLERYQKGVEMAQNWLTQAETSVMELNDIFKDAYETVVSASTNVKTDDDRAKLAEYVKQLREQVLTTLNTSMGNKYIFAGYNTTGSYPGGVLETPFQVDEDETSATFGHIFLNGLDLTAFDPSFDPTVQPGYQAGYDLTLTSSDLGYDATAEALAIAEKNLNQYNKIQEEMIQFWTGNGLTMDAQINGISLVGTGEDNLYALLDNLYKTLTSSSSTANVVEEIQKYIPTLQGKQEHLLALAADLGGRANRLEMMASRYESDYLNYTQMKSDAEDADEAELIMMYKMAESVYKAALSTGSYIIQQTLMDFLR